MGFTSSRRILLSDMGEIDAPDSPDAWVRLVGIVATRMLQFLPTEQDHWWFLVEQFDRSMTFGEPARGIMKTSPISLHAVEYEGKRSEESYVGAPNPGVVFLQRIKRDLEMQFNADLAEIVVANVYVSYITTCQQVLDQLRLKYAVHFHNNCVSSHSFSYADQWREVIQNLGGE